MGNKNSTLTTARKRQVKVVKLLEGEGLGIDDYASDGETESSNSTDLSSELDAVPGSGSERGSAEEGFVKVESFYEQIINHRKSRELQGNVFDNIRKLRNRGDLDGAKALAREFLRDNPHDIHARTVYGRLLWIQGDWPHAEQEFQHALGKNPKNVQVLRMYATFLASVHKDYKLASMLVSKAMDVEPHSRQLALLSAQIAKRGGMVHAEGKVAPEIVQEEKPEPNWQRHLPKTELHLSSELKQSAKSQHLRRQLYENSLLNSKEEERDVQLDDDVAALGSILPVGTWRGKIENIFCDLEDAVPDNPPTRAMKAQNQLWPSEWYCTDTVPSEERASTHRKLTKEDKELLFQAQRYTKWFKPHETRELEFKQARSGAGVMKFEQAKSSASQTPSGFAAMFSRAKSAASNAAGFSKAKSTASNAAGFTKSKSAALTAGGSAGGGRLTPFQHSEPP